MLARKGADPKAIMDLMGHVDLKTTMGYIASARSHLVNQMAKLNEVHVPRMISRSVGHKTVTNSKNIKKGTPAKNRNPLGYCDGAEGGI